jgi:hypothetical protein
MIVPTLFRSSFSRADNQWPTLSTHSISSYWLSTTSGTTVVLVVPDDVAEFVANCSTILLLVRVAVSSQLPGRCRANDGSARKNGNHGSKISPRLVHVGGLIDGGFRCLSEQAKT